MRSVKVPVGPSWAIVASITIASAPSSGLWMPSPLGPCRSVALKPGSTVGPAESVPEHYEERSPAFRTAEVTVPFVLLHGADDVICPPGRSAAFLRGMEARSVPYSPIVFEGEGHGVRRQDTMVSSLEAELSLYGSVFGCTPSGAEGPGRAARTAVR